MDLPVSNPKWLWKNTVYLTKHGSHAYGMATPKSDLDIRGFCIPPKEYFFGYHSKFEQAEFKGDPDMVIYDIRKFFKLAAECNPNIIETLFTETVDHLRVTPEAQLVLDNRYDFLTSRCFHTFGGYATQQLQRIHNQHKAPTEDLPFGYNTKDAMHLVRLLRVCKEILQTGNVNVKRKDCEELMAIRNGKWSYDNLIEYTNTVKSELEVLNLKCKLPKVPDHAKLEALLVEIVDNYVTKI